MRDSKLSMVSHSVIRFPCVPHFDQLQGAEHRQFSLRSNMHVKSILLRVDTHLLSKPVFACHNPQAHGE